jgi:predicted RNase H-like HicB family nuclease
VTEVVDCCLRENAAYTAGCSDMTLQIELEQEEDGRWIAAIPELRGVMVYGDTPADARRAVRALAFRVIADRIEAKELPDTFEAVSFVASAA